MSFETLGLAPAILSALTKAGFNAPTAVQQSAIPAALDGKDLMVSAQTGSGKTAAFMLPALTRIANSEVVKGNGVQVLVLAPTRELAMQVADATRTYGANLKDLRTAVVVGGMPYGAQIKALSRRVDVLVATPGRLIDHLQARRVNLSQVHTLVLDEADRMLDMGFIEDIETIVGSTPSQRQTLLFSATLDGSIARLAGKMMRDPQRIDVSGHKQKHTNITQALLYADDNQHKMKLLDHLLRDSSLDQAIVFTSTKRGADDLADRLSDQGFTAAALHGDMNQRQRTRTLGLLQNGKLRILVATDVAARGIDVQGISHAINYDLPMQPEDYTHRIGRTGRAGNDGLAYTLATHSEQHKVRRIEHFIGQPIPPETIAGLEPKGRAPSKGAKPAGKRRFGQGTSAGGRPGYAPKAGKPRSAEGSYGKPRSEGFGQSRNEGFGQSRSAEGSYGKPRSEGAYGKPRGESSYGKPRSAEGSYGKTRSEGSFGKPRGEGSYGKPRSAEGSFGKRPARAGGDSHAGRPSFGGKPQGAAKRPSFRSGPRV